VSGQCGGHSRQQQAHRHDRTAGGHAGVGANRVIATLPGARASAVRSQASRVRSLARLNR
jgi:hypothetical protein